ncbi:hypothetical protein DPMN_112220 [Dreissena polymorpha]|uniref:Uncharacterized protein n=1 Tax=Dreissena polymorpha TaxID=45954 RepID=A0A9D4KF91_DREPO|nr:hypothetical protein DPMN_112220 [Dreissena polymorpha]
MTVTGTDGSLGNQNDHGHNDSCPQRSDMEEGVRYHTKRKYRRTFSVAFLIPEDVGFLRTDESPTREVSTNMFFSTDKYPSLTTLCEELDSCDLSDLQFSGQQESNSIHINNSSYAQGVACNSEELFVKDKDGDTALHLAIILDNLVLVSKIIQMAPTYTYLSMRNKLFQTPLHLAVIMNQKHIVRKLVCAGADVTAVDRNGNTPLHIACRDGLYEIARYLLEPVRYSEIQCNPYDIPYQKIPQDFDIANYDGLTCLHLAVINRHTK